MSRKALFTGLIFDENENPVEDGYVGDEPCYIINDAGFRRHIPAEEIDSKILQTIKQQIEGHEDLISDQAAKMLGQDDIFSYVMIKNQIKQIDRQFDNLFQTGIPEEGRAYLGMMGFRIIINHHGEVINIEQPGIIDESGEE